MNEEAFRQRFDEMNSASPGSNRPKLLVSVRNVEETRAALEGGADWIDLKEPVAGSLGAVDLTEARQIVEHVAAERPVSAALGELIDWAESPARRLLEIEGLEVVKLGTAGCARQRDWPSLWQSASTAVEHVGKQLVAVAYTDWKLCDAPSPQDMISCCSAVCGRYLLLDTFNKRAGSILSHFSGDELKEVLNAARQSSITTVVAGGLSLECLVQLPQVGIDMIAVRGAVCTGDRTGCVDAGLVAEFRSSISARWPDGVSENRRCF